MTATTLIPVTLLTGFLGSGKTTLLNHLLAAPDAPETAVLINEYGETPIDHLLVRQSSDQIEVMANGCVCCGMAGDMVRTLRDLYFKRASGEVPPFTRVVIETTGLADPAPVMHTLLEMPLVAARYVLGGVVTAVDAEHALDTLSRHAESVKQVAMADRLILTKTDRVDAAKLAALNARLDALNPGAARVVSQHGAVRVDDIFATGLYSPEGKSPDVKGWLNAEAWRPLNATNTQPRHDGGIASISLRYDEPVALDRLIDVIEMIQSMRGDQLLRMKGIVNARGEKLPRVLHAVQHVLYPVGTLPAWPDHDHDTRLVFITRGVDPSFIRDAVNEWLGLKQPEAATI